MLSQSYGAPSDSELLARRIRCGAAAQGLSRAFGQLQRSKSRGFLGLFGGRDTYTMPPQLLPLAESLYHLQRGSMLGTVVGHVDERVHLYQLFLQSDALLSTAMVMPLAFQVRVSWGGTVSVSRRSPVEWHCRISDTITAIQSCSFSLSCPFGVHKSLKLSCDKPHSHPSVLLAIIPPHFLPRRCTRAIESAAELQVSSSYWWFCACSASLNAS
jgi:hypothetical protein